jgi:hypothetical protein
MALGDLAREDDYGEPDPWTAAAERMQRKYRGRNIAGTYVPQPAGPELDPFAEPRSEQVSAREALQGTPLWQQPQMQAGLPLVRGLAKTAEAVAFPKKYMEGVNSLYPPGSEEAQFLEDSRQRSATDWARKNAFNYVFDPLPAGAALARGQSLRGAMGSVGAGAGQGIAREVPRAPKNLAWRDAPNPNAPFPQYAEVYPPIGPPKMKPKTKPSFPDETYPAKQPTPEAKAFMKERAKIIKDMEENGYQPYFDVEKRFDVDPKNYPLNIDTLQIVPKKPDVLLKHLDAIGSQETRQRLQDAYTKGVELGGSGPRLTTQDWYMMGQLEADLVRQMGVKAGREAFRERFATPMAATTGGMDPRSNLIATGYMNYLQSKGERWPETHQWPVPVGARYGENLANSAQRVADEGGFLALQEANPKRHNFAGNFMGYTKPGTMDEQMTMLMQNKGVPDWYGVNERVMAEEAAKVGVDPRKFQETGWHGYKGIEGTPMISEVNAAIERTHRLTGMPRSEIVRRGWGLGDIPIYSIPGMVGAVAMGSLARQDQYQ